MSIREEMLLMMADPEIGQDIVLRWNEFVGTPTTDPVTGSQIGDVSVQTETIRGIVYNEKPQTFQRLFAEVQAGDLIVDIPADTTLTGRDGLEFVISLGGSETVWVQKKLGDRLAFQWDATENGGLTAITLLLQRKT